MLTAVDHLVLGVADVAQAVETYRNLGFTVTHGGDDEDAGHQSPYAVFGDFYIEFRGNEDAEGTHRIVLRSDNLDAEVARLKSNGFHVSDPVDDPIERRGASLPRRTAAVDSYISVGLVEYKDAAAERSAFMGGAAAHPNTATFLERTYLAVESIDRELETFEKL